MSPRDDRRFGMSLFYAIGTALLLLAGPAYSQDAPPKGITTLEERTHKVVEAASPSIVSITVDRTLDDDELRIRRSMMNPLNPFNVRPTGPVSGTILDPNGYIVTSYFNVSGDLSSLTVTLHNGKKLAAQRLGYSKRYDVALLKVEARDLPVLTKVPTTSLPVGQMVLACGRSPDLKTPTVASGIISALNRINGSYLQIDARVNYGNVGGPVTDLSSRLIGITCNVSTLSADMWGQNSGVAFVLPWEKIEQVLPKLKEGKEEGAPAYLGVSRTDEEGSGMNVSVLKDSPAAAAGIQDGDVILAFDGKKIENFDQLREAIDSKNAGDVVRIRIRRGEKEKEIKVKLGARP